VAGGGATTSNVLESKRSYRALYPFQRAAANAAFTWWPMTSTWHLMAAFIFATHFLNTVVQLDPDGTRTTIGGRAQGIVGSTSVAIDPRHPGALLVTTTGDTNFCIPHESLSMVVHSVLAPTTMKH